jgi:hypothetical protein
MTGMNVGNGSFTNMNAALLDVVRWEADPLTHIKLAIESGLIKEDVFPALLDAVITRRRLDGGQLELIDFILDKIQVIDTPDLRFTFSTSCTMVEYEVIERFIKKGMPVDATCGFDQPIGYAAWRLRDCQRDDLYYVQSVKVLQLLLENDADPNTIGYTVTLDVMSDVFDFTPCRMLLEVGAKTKKCQKWLRHDRPPWWSLVVYMETAVLVLSLKTVPNHSKIRLLPNEVIRMIVERLIQPGRDERYFWDMPHEAPFV